MTKTLRTPTFNTLNALVLALKAKLTELRSSTSLSRRHELMVDIGRIGEHVGPDVVNHIGLLVARQREVKLGIYNGRGCSKNHLTISTQLEQLIRMRGIAVCPFCEELLVCDHQEVMVAVYA